MSRSARPLSRPLALISKGIDAAFANYSKSLGTYNNNNMPFFISFISDVANEVTNDLIFAGGVNASSLLNENVGNLAQATSLATSAAQANVQVQQSKNMVVTSSLNTVSSDGKNVTFDIQWDAQSVSNAQSITVSGPGMPPATNGVMVDSLTGATTATVPAGSVYTFTVTAYGKSKADVLATVTVTADATAAKLTSQTSYKVTPSLAALALKPGAAATQFSVSVQDASGNPVDVTNSIVGSLNATVTNQSPKVAMTDVIKISQLNDQIYVTPLAEGSATVHLAYTNMLGKTATADVNVVVSNASFGMVGNSSLGRVSGAFISRLSPSIRGPAVITRPRG